MPDIKQAPQQLTVTRRRLLSGSAGIPRRTLLLAVALVVGVLLAGCGSGQVSIVTTATHPAFTEQTDTNTPVSTTSTGIPAPSSSYPLVHFTNDTSTPEGTWPFTAQLANISENPNGFPGGDTIPPQDTYLMVQVNITSGISGRTVPPPKPEVTCHAPGDQHWERAGYLSIGYDQGSTGPDPEGSSIPLGDGQPHLWDVEWVVPEGTPTDNVTCVIENYGGLKVEGSQKLN